MHEITLIFHVFQCAYYLRLVLKFPFFITSRARLEISHFLNVAVWVNDSLPSMITIIKHIKGKKLSFFLSNTLSHQTNAQTTVCLLHVFSVQIRGRSNLSLITPVSTQALDV